jgi:manganese/zinc/iron transport system permease protein
MPSNFIPPFDLHKVFVSPWESLPVEYGWVMFMGFLVGAACGMLGCYLILRRLALVGDAISHSVLPGIAVAYLIGQQRNSWLMFGGALAAGVATTLLIEVIHKRTRVKTDSAIGIVFCTLFAIGVLLITSPPGWFGGMDAARIDLDPDCVLYGNIEYVWATNGVTLGNLAVPGDVFVMGIVTLVIAALIVAFYKELLVTSFDPGLATSLGLRPGIVHHLLMAALSCVVVSSFEAVGVILVIAMLILPGATASLLVKRLPPMLVLSVVHAALSAVLGLHLGLWLDSSVAGAMVVVGAGLFTLAWIFSPSQGLIVKALHRFRKHEDPLATQEPATT